jgi:hypothetical protein
MASGKQVGVRFTAEEYEILREVVERARRRTAGLATETLVIKELMGIVEARALEPGDFQFIRRGWRKHGDFKEKIDG